MVTAKAIATSLFLCFVPQKGLGFSSWTMISGSRKREVWLKRGLWKVPRLGKRGDEDRGACSATEGGKPAQFSAACLQYVALRFRKWAPLEWNSAVARASGRRRAVGRESQPRRCGTPDHRWIRPAPMICRTCSSLMQGASERYH